MIRLPRHEWIRIYVKQGEVYKCNKCGLEIPEYTFLYHGLRKDQELCAETYIQGQLKREVL